MKEIVITQDFQISRPELCRRVFALLQKNKVLFLIGEEDCGKDQLIRNDLIPAWTFGTDLDKGMCIKLYDKEEGVEVHESLKKLIAGLLQISGAGKGSSIDLEEESNLLDQIWQYGDKSDLLINFIKDIPDFNRNKVLIVFDLDTNDAEFPVRKLLWQLSQHLNNIFILFLAKSIQGEYLNQWFGQSSMDLSHLSFKLPPLKADELSKALNEFAGRELHKMEVNHLLEGIITSVHDSALISKEISAFINSPNYQKNHFRTLPAKADENEDDFNFRLL